MRLFNIANYEYNLRITLFGKVFIINKFWKK